MKRLLVCLCFVMLALVVKAAPCDSEPCACGNEFCKLTPFTADTNYMSLPGYARWLTHKETGEWISFEEAQAMVACKNDEADVE